MFVVPIIQDYQYLDLTPIQINMELKDVLSMENIMLNISSNVVVAISTEPDVMENAAERLLGQSQQAIQDMAKDIIIGQIKLIIAQTEVENIRKNIVKINSMITENANHEVNRIGLKLVNFNITRITDKNSKILI